MAQSSSERGGVLGGALTGLAFLLVLAIGGALFTAWFVSRNVHLRETQTGRGKRVDIDTPVGSLRLEERRVDPKSLGVPAYPGARPEDSDSKSINLDFDFGGQPKQVAFRAATFVTDDSIDDVLKFYRKELPHWIVAAKRHRIEMKYSEDGYKRFIALREEDGHTHIAIAQVSEDDSN